MTKVQRYHKEIQKYDLVVLKNRQEAYYSQYAGNAERWLEANTPAYVFNVRLPYVTEPIEKDKRHPYSEFVLVGFPFVKASYIFPLQMGVQAIEHRTSVAYDNISYHFPAIDHGFYQVTEKDARTLAKKSTVGRLPKPGNEIKIGFTSMTCWLTRTVLHQKTVWALHDFQPVKEEAISIGVKVP